MDTEEQKQQEVEAAVPAENTITEGTDPVRPERPGMQRIQGGLHLERFMQIPIDAHERTHVHDKHGPESWQAKFLHFIHLDVTQYILMSLLIIDVMILFVELYLSGVFPPCHIVERDAISCCEMSHDEDDPVRFLAEDGHHDLCEEGSEGHFSAVCDDHKYPGVHTTHIVLRITTLVILSIFFIELFLVMAACGLRAFFSKFFYVLDLIIVTVSLVLEILFITLDESELELLLGLLILGRLWRFVRIGHGIFATTYELSMKELHEREKYAKKLEVLCQTNGIELPEQ